RLRDRDGVVRVVEYEVGIRLGRERIRMDVRGAVADRPVDRLRVRVDEELRRVEALTVERIPGPVHAVAVALTGADSREVGVPVERGALGQGDTLLVAVAVEE